MCLILLIYIHVAFYKISNSFKSCFAFIIDVLYILILENAMLNLNVAIMTLRCSNTHLKYIIANIIDHSFN